MMRNIGFVTLAIASVLVLSAPPAGAFERDRSARVHAGLQPLITQQVGSQGFTLHQVRNRGPGQHRGGSQLRRHPGGGRPHLRQHPGFRRHHQGRHPGFKHHPRPRHHPGFKHHPRPRHHPSFKRRPPAVHFWFGPAWPRAYPLYVPPVIVQPPAPAYVQPAPAYWYYCEDPQGYYPYVTECPAGWIPVVPHAP
jgi:hypothetical protein